MRDNDTCAPSKLKDYETRLSYVSEKLGKKALVSITTGDLEEALGGAGRIDPRDLQLHGHIPRSASHLGLSGQKNPISIVIAGQPTLQWQLK